MLIAPPARRSSVVEGPEGYEVVVPAKRHPFLMMFLGVWLMGWAFGAVTAVGRLFSRTEAPNLFLGVWLLGWMVGGGFALFTWLWMAAGRERVLLRPGVLAIRREVLGAGRTREYDLAHVRNLRVAPAGFDPFGWTASAHFWGVGGGLVAFDYGAKTFRLAAGVDEAEAAQIVRDLKARHAFLE